MPFVPDPFKIPGTNVALAPVELVCPSRMRLIRSRSRMRPFQVISDSSGLPVTTGVRFRAINDTGKRSEKFTYWDTLFDVGLKGEMGEFGDYFKTWNWETGFRYSRNEGQELSAGRGQPARVARRAVGYESGHGV